MKRLLCVFVVCLFVLAGCGGGATETPALSEVEVSVSPTPVPPSPTDTPIPPTATPLPPTPTPEPTAAEPATADLAALEEALQAVVDAQVEAGFPGVILMVDAPDLDFTWQGAGGMADAAAGIPIKTDTPFRLGGVTNMMTAVVVMRLVEEGTIDLDVPISQYLDSDLTDLLNGPNDEPYGQTITVRQLLNHTSGVAGYFFTEDRDNNGSDDFVDIVVNDPEKVWQPVEAVAYVAQNMEPQFAPGEKWGYSDTNFILAGLIIEASTGMRLSEAYQKYLFDPLGMAHTFLAQIDDPKLEDVSHVYYDDLDVSGFASLSWQWGVGGIVTTADDLNHFMRNWVDDAIFTDPSSKEAMTQWVDMASSGYDDLYSGLGMIDIDFGAMGMPEIDEIMGHNGFWNGFVYYWPKHNIVLTGTLNQVNPMGAYTGPVFMIMQTILEHMGTE